MDRNLYGFAFFTLILISAVLVKFAFFTPQPIFESPTVYVETTTATKTKCFPKVDQMARAPIDVVTLNLENRIANVNLDLHRQLNFEPSNGFAVTLHFFTGDSEPREIAAETVFIKPEMVDDATNLANVQLTCSFSWMSKLRPNQSLYVVARVAPTIRDAKNLAANYDETEATPVLLIAGKR